MTSIRPTPSPSAIRRSNPINIEAGTVRRQSPAPRGQSQEPELSGIPGSAQDRRATTRIATLAKLIYSSRLALAAAMPGEIKIAAPATDKDADVIVHPGALAYLNDDQKSFFDKYGDDIFYGLLIFPIFGSAIAGRRRLFPQEQPHAAAAAAAAALDLVRKAHAAHLPGGARSAPGRCRQSRGRDHPSKRARRLRRGDAACRFRLRSTRSASPSRRGAPSCSMRAGGEAKATAKAAAA